jgi:hypothetical protein
VLAADGWARAEATAEVGALEGSAR